MMDKIHGLLHNGHLGWWEAVGFGGSAIFFARFFVQWYATEKKKRVVVPLTFWWLSLIGSLMQLVYAAFALRSIVFTVSYLFAWIPYVRNIIIHHRHVDAHITCPACGEICAPNSNYCSGCGNLLAESRPEKNPAGR